MELLFKKALTLSVISVVASSTFAAEAAEKEKEEKSAEVKVVYLAQNITNVLEHSLFPFRKETTITDTVTRKAVSREPLPVCHLIFSREYVIPGKTHPGTAPRKEYIDIAFVPKTSGFKINNALKLDKESIVAEPFTKIFYGKYGLKWRILDSDYKLYTLYLGEDEQNYYFGNANISVLDWFCQAFHLKSGFDRMTVLAEALEAQDLDHFTSRYAIQALAKEGNAALPYLKRAIQNMIDLEHPPLEAFLCLKQIPTAEAIQLMNQYGTTKNLMVLSALFQSFADYEYVRAEYMPIYQRMVATRIAPIIAWRSVQALHMEDKILPIFLDYYEKPFCIADYSMGIRYPAEARKINIGQYLTAKKHIQDYLIRNGDLPHTLKVYNLEEKDADREARIANTDAERIKEDSDFLANASEKDLSFLMAVELAVFDINEKGVNPAYLQRVRNAGIAIMKRLPEEMVRRELDKLIKNLPNGKEANFIAAASREVRNGN